MAWIISWQLMGRDSFSSTLAAASKALSFLASVPAACTALPSTSGWRRLRAAAALLAAPLLAAPLLAAASLAAVFAFVVDIGFSQLRCRAAPCAPPRQHPYLRVQAVIQAILRNL